MEWWFWFASGFVAFPVVAGILIAFALWIGPPSSDGGG